MKSPAQFRRLFDAVGRQEAANVYNATNGTDALPTVELTVGAQDGGSPPRSQLRRLTVVVDVFSAGPDGVPVITSSTSTFYYLSWTQRLFIVVGSALGAALIATIVFIVVVSYSH